MKRFEIVLEATTCLLMVLVLAVLATLVERLRNESPIISLSYDGYVDEEAKRFNKYYEDLYTSALTNEYYYIDNRSYECATTNEYADIYSLVWDERKIRKASEFYRLFEQEAIENPYSDETDELSPYSLFPDGGKLIDAFDAKYSCKCSEIGAPK